MSPGLLHFCFRETYVMLAWGFPLSVSSTPNGTWALDLKPEALCGYTLPIMKYLVTLVS